MECYQTGETGSQIISFSPDVFEIDGGGAYYFSDIEQVASNSALVAGDIQGRGLLLGAPQVLRFQYASTNLIIGSPPMHVDHVTPVGSSDAVDLNLSAMSGQAGYSAGLVTSEIETVQTTQKSTTSFNAAEAIQGTLSTQLGGVFWGFDASVTAAAQAVYDAQVSSVYNTYGEIQSTATATTGFGDLLDYNLFRVNVYAYPVIGQSACLADEPDCASSDEVPLYMIYSGTDQQTIALSSGAALEWYQPPQQPGNIFSYPATLALLNSGRQLTDAYFDLDSSSLTPTTGLTTIFTDDIATTIGVNWSGSAGEDMTTGSTKTFAASLDGTLGTRLGPKKGDDVTADLTVKLGGKAGFSALQSGKQSFSGSAGLTISKPGTFPNPIEYSYALQGVIVGRDEPSGLDTGTTDDLSTPPTISTTGPIEVAFTADPKTTGSGQWWSSTSGYVSQPDVALNHPSQWDLVASTGDTGSNCIPNSVSGPDKSCATFNTAPADLAEDPGDLWTSGFYQIKGLMLGVLNEDGLTSPHGQNPVVVEGQTLSLNLRVYNYSLAFMPSGSSVKVRFYYQPWSPYGQIPAGDSVLIAEETAPSIPPFSEEALNWELVNTTLDTTGLGGQYLLFWAVAWIENEDGSLAEEMPLHGLNALPAAGITDISQIDAEQYSNNVGYYHLPFYVLNSEQPTQAQQPDAFIASALSIAGASAEPDRALIGTTVEVSAPLAAVGGPESGLMVTIADGNPKDGGRVFDVELVAYIPDGGEYQVRVPFRPATCGTHEILFTAYGTGDGQPVETSTYVDAVIDPAKETRNLARFVTTGADLPRSVAKHLGHKLYGAAKSFDKGHTQAGLAKLSRFERGVERYRSDMSNALADALIDDAQLRIAGCVSAGYQVSEQGMY